MHHDEIPKLPQPLPHELKEENVSYEEFENATCRFLLYEGMDKEPKVRFDKLDDTAYANYVAVLSQPWNAKAYEFLKLVLEGVRLVTQHKKKSFETVIRVEKFIQSKNTNINKPYEKQNDQ